MSEREHAAEPPSTRRSIRAVGAATRYLAGDRSVGRSDRPSSIVGPEPQYHEKGIRRRRRLHHRAASSRCANQAARAGRDAPRRNRGHHRQGIKNASSPAGNVGERARRSLPPQRGVRSGRSAPATPYLDSGRSVGRSDRPSSIVGPEPQYYEKGIRRRRRHHHRAATSRCTNQAARAGRDAPRQSLRRPPAKG